MDTPGRPAGGLSQGKLKFSLEGEKLAGSWNLVRTQMDGRRSSGSSSNPVTRRRARRASTTSSPPSPTACSVTAPGAAQARREGPRGRNPACASQDTRQEADTGQAKGKGRARGAVPAELPEHFKPQLATLVDTVPGGDWRYEIKFDGYRMLARIDAGEVRLFTRNGHDWTAKMPQQAAALAGLGLESGWLDGEVVVLNEEGTPDFQALQNAFEAGAAAAFSIICSTCLT